MALTMNLTNVQREQAEFKTATGEIVTLTDAKGGQYFREMKATIVPVQSGSGDPSPTNIRPISGWSEAKVTRTGKNLMPKFTSGTSSALTYTAGEDGSVHVTGTNTGIAFFATQFTLPEGTYILSGAPPDGQLTIRNALGGGTPDSAFSGQLDDYGSECTFTVSKTASAWLNIRSTAGTHDQMYYPMIRVASDTDATYEPYNGQTVTIDLDGTRYGGTLDVRRGKLRVKKGIKVLDGSEAYYWHNSGVAHTSVPNGIITDATTQYQQFTMCDKLQRSSWAGRTSKDNCCGIFYGSSRVFIKSSSNFSDAASAKAWVADNPLQVVYELATPVEVDLTPTEITTLLGINNIWADTGEVTVTYKVDPNAEPTLTLASPLRANLGSLRPIVPEAEEIIAESEDPEIGANLSTESEVQNGETEME